ncbi:DHA2 family efflux MFS transporter permease subunit [Aestuariivirga sp.]|uniref:DHA2 family efflux MFS transporter permease subunit n=1 Tax=Aestuariivirga sp. TaxID=2650926 RepID=UPI003593BC80
MSDIALPRNQSAVTRWLGFAALCAGMFMAVLDIQIVITSLTVIEEALGIGADRMSWVQTAYLIAEVIAIPITGLLTRVFSLRWLVAGAITIFTLASIGCALSTGFDMLIAFRVIQGFAGGVLIPVVFSAIFLLFRPGPEQTIATTLGGMLAVLAPAVGPITGGLLTENFSWHWLFLINVLPGILTVAVAMICLPRETMQFGLLRRLDVVSLLFIALALAGLEIGLKEAPDLGWLSPTVLGLFAAFAFLMWFAIRRPQPAVDFALLRDRHLAFGCGISFVLGIGLFGAVYLLPVFLAFVRHMGPVDIGVVVLVTGVAQIVSAPIAVLLDQKMGARLLTAIGFALFTAGLFMNGFATRESDFDDLFWPQILRGCAVALCILPVTRFALGLLPLGQVSDASGLYNLSRNLGGAIGIALIDTVLFTRAADHAGDITDLIKDSPEEAAAALGVGLDELPDPDDPLGFMGIMDTLQEVSLTLAINEAWLMLAALSGIALILVWAMGPIRVPDGHVTLRSRSRF